VTVQNRTPRGLISVLSADISVLAVELRRVRFNCRAGPGDYRRHLPRGFSSMLLSAIRSRGFYSLIDRCPNPAASYCYTAALGRKHLTTYGRRESVPSRRLVDTNSSDSMPIVVDDQCKCITSSGKVFSWRVLAR
jgi:hypothetical protein